MGIVGETLGLAISLIAKKKNLPLILLQICISVTYFCMMSIDPGEIQQANEEIIGILSKGVYGVINTYIELLQLWYMYNYNIIILSKGAYGVMFVAHINMGLATAAMGLLWMITVEAYPKKYR